MGWGTVAKTTLTFVRSGFNSRPLHHLAKGSCVLYDVHVNVVSEANRGSNIKPPYGRLLLSISLIYNNIMTSLAFNKRAKFNYDIKDTFDAGLVLSGAEVKAAKEGNTSLAGAYVKVTDSGATLVGAHIGPYKYAKQDDYNPTHDRALLLNKSELAQMIGKEKGLTVVPMEIYVAHRGLVKVKIGIGRGRKKQDKREYLKTRDSAKEIRNSTDR